MCRKIFKIAPRSVDQILVKVENRKANQCDKPYLKIIIIRFENKTTIKTLDW